MFRQPGPRFVFWVVVLVGVATAAGLAHLAWWLIAVVEFVAWAVVAVVERSLSHPAAAGAGTLPVPPAPLVPEFEELSYVRVLPPSAVAAAATPPPAPEPVVAIPAPPPPPLQPVVAVSEPLMQERPERKAGLISRPFRAAVARPQQSVSRGGRTFGGQPREWNIWSLERLARDQAGDNDELGFIVTYLRDYASPEGLLPLNFDSLVRESFGDLLLYAPV